MKWVLLLAIKLNIIEKKSIFDLFKKKGIILIYRYMCVYY